MNFQAEKLLGKKRVQKKMEGEELNNPMKVLKNQTKDSELELEVLKNLQGLKKLNQKQADLDFQGHAVAAPPAQEGEAKQEDEEWIASVEEARKRRLLRTLTQRTVLLPPALAGPPAKPYHHVR